MAKSKSKRWQTPQVVFQPEVHQGIQRGVDQIVNTIRPTLGPLPRMVMYDPTLGAKGRVPEILDDGGTIARRIIQIKDRDEDVGAMLIRQMLWSLREEVGDGTATAALLFQAVYAEGLRYLASGGNAMRLRRYLDSGMRVILDQLDGMVFRVEGKEDLGKLAGHVCRDPALGRMFGEIFDIIGEFGRLEIRSSDSREYDREYVEGMYWDSGFLSRSFITNIERQRVELDNPAILLTDLPIEDARDMIPVLATSVKQGIENLVIICSKISDVAIGVLNLNRQQGHIKVNVVAAKTPGFGAEGQRAALTDLAILTGGKAFFGAAGATLRSARAEHLGYARRIWMDRNFTGVVGGRGDARRLREHIASLRRAFEANEEPEAREKIRERIGKLLGGAATLRVGGTTNTEQEFNKELAKRTAEAMRGAMREGVVPGGGIALRACRPALRALRMSTNDPDEQAAFRILETALEAPTRALLENAGVVPGEVYAELNAACPECGYDVLRREIVNMREAGIVDIATVVKAAVRSAVSMAAIALTTDVVVHRAAAPEAFAT